MQIRYRRMLQALCYFCDFTDLAKNRHETRNCSAGSWGWGKEMYLLLPHGKASSFWEQSKWQFSSFRWGTSKISLQQSFNDSPWIHEEPTLCLEWQTLQGKNCHSNFPKLGKNQNNSEDFHYFYHIFSEFKCLDVSYLAGQGKGFLPPRPKDARNHIPLPYSLMEDKHTPPSPCS